MGFVWKGEGRIIMEYWVLGRRSMFGLLYLQLGTEWLFFSTVFPVSFYKCLQPSITTTPGVNFLPCLHLEKAIRNYLFSLTKRSRGECPIY